MVYKIFNKQSLVAIGLFLLMNSLVSTAVSAADMEPAVEQYMQGEYAAALPKLSQLAREGNPEAQFALGLAYEHGRSVSQNPMMAMYWYDLAAKTYAQKGASIASRFSREAVARLHYKHHAELLASKQ